MARLTLWVISSLVVLVLLSCGGGSSKPTPSAESATATNGPTATADAEPGAATSEAPQRLQHLEGDTMAFGYPPDWNVWSQSFNGKAERIVIANIPVQPETDELPAGGIKIAFESPGATGPTLSPNGAQETMTLGPDAVPFALFRGRSTAPWSLRGGIITGGRAYYAFVDMNTEAPALDVVKSILETWTLKP